MTNTTEIQKIIRNYLENLYSKKKLKTRRHQQIFRDVRSSHTETGGRTQFKQINFKQ